MILVFFRHLRMTELCEALACRHHSQNFFESLKGGPFRMEWTTFFTAGVLPPPNV